MFARLTLGVIATACLAISPHPAAADNECSPLVELRDAALAANVDPIVDAAVAKGFGGQVAIVRQGALVYARAAGLADNAGQVTVTPATMFHVASITKYLTAALVLRAAEEGRLALADRLSRYFPQSTFAQRGVTIGDLLAHRSGLGSSYAAEDAQDAAAAIRAIDAAPYDASKVGNFRYSNDGYDLLAIVLERVYGMTYEQLARSRVFGQACLQHSGFWGETALSDPHVVGQPLSAVPDKLKRRNYGMIGSAGYLTTAIDLAQLQNALARERILRRASLDALWSGHGTTSIGEVGFGNFVIAHPALGLINSARGAEEWGDNAILNHYRREDTIVAVVTSRGPKEGSGDRFRDTISKAIEAILVP